MKILLFILAFFAANSFAQNISELEAKCDKGEGNACEQAGNAYLNGDAVEKSNDKATELFEKACTLKVGKACASLVRLYVSDEGMNPDQDAIRASTYYQKACNYGWAPSCINLGVFYYLGIGVPQSKEKAREYYEKACSMNDGQGCYSLGNMYLAGEGGPKSENKALEYFKKGCELHFEDACQKARNH